VARHIFQACPVWMHTQSNITNIKILLGRKLKQIMESLLLDLFHQKFGRQFLTI
jgi:hypothetical protein